MRIVTIKQVKELSHGEIIPSFRAKVIDLYDRNSGTNSNGEWSIQNMMVDDGTGKVKVKVQDREALAKSWKGKTILVSCNNGSKGLTGIKAKDDEYRGKTERIISVTPTAVIEDALNTQAATDDEDEGPQPGDDEPPQEALQPRQQSRSVQQPAQRQNAAPAQTQAAPAHNGNGNGHAADPTEGKRAIICARKRLGRAVNSLELSFDAAIHLAGRVNSKMAAAGLEPLGPEEIEKIAVHFNMTLTKEDFDLNLPTGSMDEYISR